jgi:DNA polymerase-4
VLAPALGSHAVAAQRLAAGIDARAVEPAREEKSIGNERTFDQDLETLAQARQWLMRLCEKVGERVRAAGLRGRTVTVKLRIPPFETATRQCTLADPVDATGAIHGAALSLLESWWKERSGRRLRLLGVTLSGFEAPPEQAQVGLFAAPPPARRPDQVLDRINRRFGKGAIGRASGLAEDPDRD